MCKTFLEGKGMPWEEKYKAVTKRFLNTFVFLTMNTLPKNLRQYGHKKETQDEWIERDAHLQRCSFYNSTDQFDPEVDSLKYDTADLAKYLVHLIALKRAEINKPEPSNLEKRSFQEAFP